MESEAWRFRRLHRSSGRGRQLRVFAGRHEAGHGIEGRHCADENGCRNFLRENGCSAAVVAFYQQEQDETREQAMAVVEEDYLTDAPPVWRHMCQLVDSGVPYDKGIEADFPIKIDPIYEAKCVKFLQPGDLLWVVGIREGGA